MSADAEVDADELLVLLRPALPCGGLLELLERGGHTGTLGSGGLRGGTLLRGTVGSLSERRLLSVARGWGGLAVTGGRGRSLGCLGLAVAGRQRGRLAGDLAVRRRLLLARLAVGRGRRGRGWHLGAAGRGVHGRDDGRGAMHSGRRRRREALRGGLGSGRRRGGGRRCRCGGRGRGRFRSAARDAERGRGEARGGAGLRLLRGGRGRFLGNLAAEVLEQRVETAVEALPDGGEPPDVLEVEVAQHHGPFGGELRSVEGVAGHLVAARDDADVPGGDLRHLAGAVDRRREGQLLDLRRYPVERHPEGLRIARLGAQELKGFLGGLRLVEEDEVAVVREPFVGVEAETADVEAQSGARDLHAYVQIRARGEVTDPGLVAALEFPGHA